MSVRLNWLKVHARNWMDSDDGATALEYAVLVVGIVVLLAAGALIFGGELRDFFSDLFPNVVAAPPAPTP
ncbi:MAG: Flp family type IVb pilin [Coriobacteriia bacterium]|nr:Flp family type IVb pilin [Coriobacteriia bacterium]